MKPRQYRPDLSIKYAPRVPARLRKAVGQICQECDMPEADVLRYSFEASVLTAPRRLTSAMAPAPDPLNSMMTIRTSREIHECVMELWREHPNTLKADILRALLERIIPIALDRGMAAVLKIREKRLRRIN